MQTDPKLPEILGGLKPNHYRRYYQQYEILDGYLEYNINCKEACKRYTDNEFEGQGVFPVLSSEQCTTLRDMIDEGDPALREHEVRLEILNTVITPSIDDAMLAYFESEYHPIWMKFFRNDPGKVTDEDVSFKWHLDGGPEKHLKMLVYLNDSDESGGDTLFLSHKSTFKLKVLGYALTKLDKRTSDLTELCNLYDIPYSPVGANCKEGECVLFAPMQYLHRGVWPTKGPRYIVQICFVPSKMPWLEACQKHKTPLTKSTWPNVSN